LELAVAAVAAWVWRRAGRVGEQVGEQVDEVLDAGVQRLGELVARKLAGDSALEKLQVEAAGGEVSERTRDRVRLSLEEAVAGDERFAAALDEALRRVHADAGSGPSGAGATTVFGGVTVRAEGGSNAAWQITGPVTIGLVQPQPGVGEGGRPPDPPVPGRV
jgi:hypothetical protein